MADQDHEQVRTDLRHERTFTDAVMNTIACLIVVLDRDGKVIRFNRMCEQVSGYTLKEIKGKELWDVLLLPEEKEAALIAFKQLASGKGSITHENHWKSKTGARRLISWTATSILDEKGTIEYVIGSGIDVTDRRKSEELQANLASIVLNSDDAIVSETLDGVVTSWNRGAERMFGYTASEAIGRSISIIIPPDRPYEIARFLSSIRKGERVRHYETERVCKDGRRIYVSLSLSPLADARGAIIGVSKIARDVSEQKRAEEAQSIGEARLNGIIGSAMDAIISINDQQRIIVFNAAAEKMFKCAASEALGAPLDRFIPERFRAEHSSHVESFGKTGATSRAMGKLNVISGLRSDGTEFPIEATISQVNVGGHKIFSAIVRDVTERYRVEQERAEMQSKILHQEKLAGIGLLASGMAHEIGNPLASIQAVCDNQLRKPLDPKVAEKFQRIRDQIARIVQIVRQLVNFARRDPDVWKLVSINDQIEAALMIARLSRESKSAHVTLDLHPALPQTVCVGDQLSQVFLNLFLNAFDAMKDEEGKIVVKSSLSETGRIVVSVEDNGTGIPEQSLSNLFVPFFTTKEVGKGTGLGLHVSQGIVQRHGGEITVKSQVNRGTTFTVEIPVQANPPREK
jgi:PAS domain S-box-containing protein